MCGDNPTVRELIDYEQFCGIRPAAQAAAASALPPEQEMTVEELKNALDRRVPLFVLDVREPQEFQICRIPGSTLIPLGELSNRLAELPSGPGCSAARRALQDGRPQRQSRQAAARSWLYAGAQSHRGILAWIDKVDPAQLH